MQNILTPLADINAPIGIFDSGIGGLTTLAEITGLLPHESFIYYADNAMMPYGNKPQEVIIEATVSAVDTLAGMGVKAIVVACNTATTTAVYDARKKHNRIVVGIEPAIAPASRIFPDEKILIICTEATSKQEKFISLCARYQNKKTIILPQKDLAYEIEYNIDGLEKTMPVLEDIFLPHLDAGAIVLGCTHYLFVSGLIRNIYTQRKRNAVLFDGNYGVAKQLKKRLSEEGLLQSGNGKNGKIEVICTKGSPLPYYDIYNRYSERQD